MKKRTRSTLVPLATLGVGAAAGYSLVARPWHMRWGATPEEIARPMPGDELVERPRYVSNRAITVHARPDEVWPWLVQIGTGRAGFYSYEWFERLVGMTTTTVEHLLPEFQSLEPGELIPAGRGLHLPVRAVEPHSSIVFGTRPEEPAGAARASWSLGLYPTDGATRLVSRVRSAVRWHPGSPLLTLFLGPVHFTLERRMLLGIRQRAEDFAARATTERQGRPRHAPEPGRHGAHASPRPGASPRS